ncbi:MAG: hypothetical protein Q9223_005709 [Gallowayella weberi]
MTSKPFQSIYQQYKHDTNVVASWLATTAMCAGYKGPLGDSSTDKNSMISSGRLKGKGRKQAKAASVSKIEQSEPSKPVETSKPKYTLAIKDFVPLAEYIADASDSAAIKLPTAFSIALERVIWVRKSFSEKLEAAGRRFDQKSDARHSFFVAVLEKVSKTLQPLMNVNTFNLSNLKDVVTNISVHGDQKGLSNLFEVLDVYEPSASLDSASDSVASPPCETEYAVETEENSIFEALFAMTTLMDDLSRLRIEIRECWARYEAGEMDIAAASVATNTAIELAHSFEDEIGPLLQKNGGTSMFHVQYFYGVSEALGMNAEARQKPTDDYNFAAYDVADALFINTLINIIAFVRVNPLGEIPSYNGLYGWYDEDSISCSWSGRQKYSRMKPALLEMLSDLPLMSNKQCPVEDQLIHGMMTTLRSAKRERKATPDVPIWFSFAAQIYLDTLNVVKIGKGWTDMQRVMLTIQQSVYSLPTSCSERKRVLDDMKLWEKGVDPIAMIRKSFGRPYKDYTFLRRHFLHCGLWVHYLRVRFHQQGVAYAAVPGTILYTMQLYHALRQENCLHVDWKDLETLRKMQGNSTFFIGEPPSSFEGYHNNFCLTLGVSITNWAPNKRDQKLKVTKENKPLMKYLAMTSTLFAQRTHPSDDRMPVSASQVENWIQRSNKNQADIKDDKTKTTTKNKETRPPLINSLAAAIAMEIPNLEFDYFAMHNQCRELLVRLQTDLEKVTGPELTKKYMSQGRHNIAFVVGFVFASAAGKKGIVTTTVPSTRLMEIAAETFKQWLLEEQSGVIGGTESAEMK